MARRRPAHASDDPQLTLEGWGKTLSAEQEQARTASPTPSAVALLADALAPKLAQELSSRIPAPLNQPPSSARLLTLDQLVAELPPAKRPQTWKRWLYERTRRNEIPGCVKLGGMLFFEREPALAWLRAGATTTR